MPSTQPMCLKGGCLRFLVSDSGHMGVRVTNDFDLSYVLSTSLSGLWEMEKQNVGILGIGIQVGVTEIVLLTTSSAKKVVGLNSSNVFGVSNNKMAKYAGRVHSGFVPSIPLQVRNTVVLWHCLGIRKPFWT